MNSQYFKWALLSSILILLGVVIWFSFPNDKIDFNTQVKPILNKNCIACHGGVKQSGGFSLLFEEEAKGNTQSGTPAIIPGYPGKSEMIRRVQSHDLEERMPFKKKPLSKKDINTLSKWIKEGANWDTHWAYVPVKKIEIPDLFSNDKQFNSWAKNDIDYFIYKKLKELKLNPSKQAKISTLARRMSLDLIGLPPPAKATKKLFKNPSDESLEYYIDELLSSPHFGEKWTGMWMDLARYSDTKGYEADRGRTIWKYRDWLIEAFNADKPYNQFLTEQIAGDLLPDPTDDNLIATAFHRNTMTNDEGGTDNEEFRVASVIDRVNTTWEVAMGTTFSCVQCHSHPFDPFKQEDYYKFMSYFNNTRDEDTPDDYPLLRHFVGEDSLKLIELRNWLKINTDQKRLNEITLFLKTWQPSINSLVCDKYINSELAGVQWVALRNNSSCRLQGVKLDGKNSLIYRFKSHLPGGIWKIHLDSINGTLLKEISVVNSKNKWIYQEIDFQQTSGRHDLYFTYYNPNLKHKPRDNGLMFDWFHFTEKFPGEKSKGYKVAKGIFWKLMIAETLLTPIMVENPESMKRETRVFERGNWLSKGDLVEPGVPEILKYSNEDISPDRLGIVTWMVNNQNPLTARTYVNRIWEQLFGYGIVKTLEDFGSQGIPPTHTELIDHLSWKFMHDFNWSTKALLKYIVLSATYRQSSSATREILTKDPQNKYYARGPRVRLSAEQIRDQALHVSGLLSEKMNGPSVMPYQPENIWNSPYGSRKWKKSKGEDQYRRALYTYWKRTSPYPSLILFDVMAREVCSSRRINTNTPLQALVTLNDSVYVEASFHFAKRMVKEGGGLPRDQIKYGYKLMMYKDISDEKLAILVDFYQSMKDDNGLMIKANYDKSIKEKHFSAMTIVANTMLNLDEFIVKN